jgi:hypothetical protein
LAIEKKVFRRWRSIQNQLKKTPGEKRNKTLIDTLAAVAVATMAAKWIAADKKSVRQQLKKSRV